MENACSMSVTSGEEAGRKMSGQADAGGCRRMTASPTITFLDFGCVLDGGLYWTLSGTPGDFTLVAAPVPV